MEGGRGRGWGGGGGRGERRGGGRGGGDRRGDGGGRGRGHGGARGEWRGEDPPPRFRNGGRQDQRRDRGQDREERHFEREENRYGDAAADHPMPATTRRKFHLGYKKLQELMGQTPEEILTYLTNSNNGLQEFLESDETTKKPDQVDIILKLILRALEERIMTETLSNVINMVAKGKFLSNFSNLILDMAMEKRSEKQKQYNTILKNALTLSETLMLKVPSLAFAGVFQITSNLDRLLPVLKTATVIVDDQIITLLTQLNESTNHYLRHATPRTEEYKNTQDDQAPPDDFRTLSTIPTKDDLHLKEEPFLRVNKINGSYNNVDHYLDVQYRLLREDFIAPLREGIDAYLTGPRRDRKRKLDNVIVYQNVRFVKPECSSAGIVYILQLDTNSLKNVRWQSSKRLIYGSLVCLSKDDFKTFIIATIHERKIEILESKCQVSVQLPDLKEAKEQCNFDASYVMLETTSYFESYRHNLQGLQEIGQNMAFKEHIVFCSATVAAPNYLTRTDDVRMDFSAIMPPDSSERIVNSFKRVNPLEQSTWPQAEHLSLDVSQWRALVNAITKRLSIVQGPPGTGKTYIGLKVAKFLLDNYQIWADDGQAMRPILVVCYTNHALDQFLEGILKFTDASAIVRVGGRSKSVDLEACMLKTLRRNVDKRAANVRGAFQALRDNTEQMTEAENEMVDLAKQTEGAQKGILTANDFLDYMSEEHYNYLPFDFNQGEDQLKRWLGFHGDRLRQIVRQAAREYDEVEDEEEPDIMEEPEAVEAERALDIDEEWEEILSGKKTTRGEMVHDEDDDQDWANFSRNEKKLLRRKLIEYLNDPDVMTDEQAERVRNPWHLNQEDRWRLYRYWVKQYLADMNTKVNEQETKYMELVRQRNELNNQKDATIMAHAKVVGMTTTGCARYRQILARIQPKIVIVEEAAEVLEAHIVTSLSESCEHLIMIGDHKQLRPNPAVYRLAKKFNLDISLFERMIKNNLPYVCLQRQHRMRPQISEPMNFIYPELQNAKSVGEYEEVLGVRHNMYYVDHGHHESADRETKSHSNRHEAEFCIRLCRYFLQQGYAPSQITILTPYYGQLLLFKDYIRNLHLQDVFNNVRITVVDNFQGEENDIIILSLVRSNSDGNIGFLSTDNRVCVALSRAKKGFFVIGNIQLLKANTKSDLWSKIEQHLLLRNLIGESLELKCQIHGMDPDAAPVMVSKASDFDMVAEGGCRKFCEYRLQCGHVCPRQCHIYDRDHLDMLQRCRNPCTRSTCGNAEHRCGKPCNVPCGPCNYDVTKVLPKCGHTQKVKCGENLDVVTCKRPCGNKLRCGHPCLAGCSRPCDQYQCSEMVEKTLRCGHKQQIPCHKPLEEAVCREHCPKQLACDHGCAGNCQTCYGGRLHKACSQKCGRTLVCGHACKEPCTKNCPPCSEKCENRCVHSKCMKKCGEQCVPCTEPCGWACVHKRCTKLCHQQCDRERCDEPCPKQVPAKRSGNKRQPPQSCGHPCIGLCGEPCPKLCRICDRDQVQQIFFGDEDEPETRFVELSDCRHIFSVSGLDTWMDQPVDQAIQLKKCPKCNTAVRQHLRYGNMVKARLRDVELAKNRIRGDTHSNNSDVEFIRRTMMECGPAINQSPQTSQLLRFVGVGSEQLPCMYPKLKELWSHVKEFMSGEDPNKQPRNMVTALRIKSEFMKQLVEIISKFEEIIRQQGFQQSEIPEFQTFLTDLEHMASYLYAFEKRTRTGKPAPRYTFSGQQIKDLNMYVLRLRRFSKYLVLVGSIRRTNKEDPKHLVNQGRRLLTETVPYTDQTDADVTRCLEGLQKLCNISGLGITDEERRDIVKAIGLSSGHWFKCPRGHVYAIGECGGAMQQSRCPECGAGIGGTQHRLLGDNAVATEMDGARYAAYDAMAHMDDYDPEELRRIAGL